MKTARFEVLSQAEVERICEWTSEGLIRNLDRGLRARTFKGLVGPLAYQVMKGIAR